MRSFKSLLLAVAVGAMALASSAASAFERTVTEPAKSLARDVGQGLHDATFGFLRAAGLVLSLVTSTDTYTGRYPIRATVIDSDVLEVPIPFTLPAAAPGVNDIIQLIKIPAGQKIVDWFIVMSQVDTGTGTFAFSLGSLNSLSAPTALTTTYGAGLTASAAAGTTTRQTNAAALNESNASDRAIGLLVTAAANVYAASRTGMLVLKLSDA